MKPLYQTKDRRTGLEPWNALRVAGGGYREMWLLDGIGGRFWFWRPASNWDILAYAVVRR